jgi:hypothetical protein
MVLEISQYLFRRSNLIIHVLTVSNLKNPFENDLFSGSEPLIDDKDIVLFTVDMNFPLMSDSLLIDHIHILLR